MRSVSRHLPSPAIVIACTSLVVALGGTGYAAFRLPANSVGSKQVINGSLQALDLSKSARKALRGSRGPHGLTGPQGAKGDTGPQGPKGDTGAPGPLTTTLPSGQTLRGDFTLDDEGRAANSILASSISFGGFHLASSPALAFVAPGGSSTASCPGTSANPEAAPGTLCFYFTLISNVTTMPPYTLGPGMSAEDATTFTDGQTDAFGAILYAQVATAGRGDIVGTWAVTAP